MPVRPLACFRVPKKPIPPFRAASEAARAIASPIADDTFAPPTVEERPLGKPATSGTVTASGEFIDVMRSITGLETGTGAASAIFGCDRSGGVSGTLGDSVATSG